jgi:hypothetical protein
LGVDIFEALIEFDEAPKEEASVARNGSGNVAEGDSGAGAISDGVDLVKVVMGGND